MPKPNEKPDSAASELITHTLAMHGVTQGMINKSPTRCEYSTLVRDRATARRACRDILQTAQRETRDLSAAEMGAYDLAASMVGTLSDEIEVRNASGHREGRIPGAGQIGQGGHGASAHSAGMLSRDQLVANTVEHLGSGNVGIGHLIRANLTNNWEGLEEFRGQSANNNPAGGFLVPEYLSARVIDLSRNASRVIQAGALTVPISGPTKFAVVDGDVEANWRAENEEIPESDMVFGERTFVPKTLAALVRCSIELVEDAPNLSELVERSISAQLGLGLDKMCLVGDGVGKPLGLFNTPGINVITPDGGDGELEDFSLLSRAVEAVRNNNADPGAFLMSSRTSGELDRLVDQDGNPLVPPHSVANRTALITNQIPTNLAPGTASAIFTGQWEDYYVAMRTSLVLEATRVGGEDTFKKMQVLIRGYLRADGFAVRPNHFAVIKGITPPA